VITALKFSLKKNGNWDAGYERRGWVLPPNGVAQVHRLPPRLGFFMKSIRIYKNAEKMAGKDERFAGIIPRA